ncbi:hypothetical protein CANMA_003608 [Candida margitis]|uniref:uncharacterized protein n=1 Tax=Candida margitis TaxID=1775924 RepID=UPI002227BC8F|nr:uncharacterized protein CANMA_003608 [Candida margitis]KAI5962833.1 hypothetical protein CANMA_003608 [Candida margitis]
MFSFSSTILVIITLLLAINIIQFLLWLFRGPLRDEQAVRNISKPPFVDHHHQERVTSTHHNRNEATGSVYTTSSSVSPNESYANFRARLLAARESTRPQSKRNMSSSTQWRDGKQVMEKIKGARIKMKQKFQNAADKYSKRARSIGRRNSSAGENSIPSTAPNYDDDDPPPPYTFTCCSCPEHELRQLSSTMNHENATQPQISGQGTIVHQKPVVGSTVSLYATEATVTDVTQPQASHAREDDVAPPSYYESVGQSSSSFFDQL